MEEQLSTIMGPAWLVALATSAFLGAKAVVFLKQGSKGDSPSSSSLDEWRGRMIGLAERQQIILDRVANQQMVLVQLIDKIGTNTQETTKTLRLHDEFVRRLDTETRIAKLEEKHG